MNIKITKKDLEFLKAGFNTAFVTADMLENIVSSGDFEQSDKDYLKDAKKNMNWYKRLIKKINDENKKKINRRQKIEHPDQCNH